MGARPLTAAEAGPALFAYDLAYRANEAGAAGGFHPSWPAWIKFAVAGLFAAFGASDFTARIVPAGEEFAVPLEAPQILWQR